MEIELNKSSSIKFGKSKSDSIFALLSTRPSRVMYDTIQDSKDWRGKWGKVSFILWLEIPRRIDINSEIWG